MNILISNDDGVFKYGLKVLANALAQMEDVNVYAVGPAQERSCAGHGLMLHADCVKSGISIARLNGIPIDMVCTGINHGSNLGRDIHYSGTISAAMEGLFMHVPSIAFSLCSHSAHYFEAFPSLVPQVVKAARNNVPADTIISVNVPDIPADQLKGVRVCPVGPRDYTDGIKLVRKTEKGGVYNYISEPTYRDHPDPDWDVSAWRDGWVTITPIRTMRENAPLMDLVRSWKIGL